MCAINQLSTRGKSKCLFYLPYFFESELRPRRLFDQNFGLQLSPSAILSMKTPLWSRDYYRPLRLLEAATKDLGSTITSDKDKFEINLDVQQFSPAEITVKTANGYVVVEGKHEEKKDEHGYISRQFVRRYALPKDFTPETVESCLSSDGVLTVAAPKKPEAVSDQRTVNIERVDEAFKKIKAKGNEEMETS